MSALPYRLTAWRGDFITLGTFATFDLALAAYAACAETDKQLLNDDVADEGRSGLTDEQKDAVLALPATRVATSDQLARALRRVA